jgi:hypothetical protein
MPDILKEHKITLNWENNGRFNAEIVNGNITKLHFCQAGKDEKNTGECLTCTDFKFLTDVYEALGELFAVMAEQQKELKYSFPTDEKIEVKP